MSKVSVVIANCSIKRSRSFPRKGKEAADTDSTGCMPTQEARYCERAEPLLLPLLQRPAEQHQRGHRENGSKEPSSTKTADIHLSRVQPTQATTHLQHLIPAKQPNGLKMRPRLPKRCPCITLIFTHF